MAAILFLLSVWLNGLLTLRLIRKSHLILPFSFIIGSLVTVTPIFLISSYVTHSLLQTLIVYSFVVVIGFAVCIAKGVRLNINVNTYELLIFMVLLFFGWYIFSKGFSYDTATHSLLISSNTYMDFGAHIALIRSFSKGHNFPPSLPFFAMSGGAYYYVTDFFAGVLEYLGFRIDIALNCISAIAFASVGMALYATVKKMQGSPLFGICAVLIFFCSNSFEWLYFLRYHANPASWFGSIYHMSQYSTAVEVFWNLNTYLNQRQLVFGIAMFCWFIFSRISNTVYISQKEQFLEGILLGLLSYWHMHVFVASVILFVINGKQSVRSFAVALVVALPQLVTIFIHSATHVAFSPGFIVTPLTVSSWVLFWIKNTGLLFPLACIGMLILGKKYRVLSIVTIAIFILPNLFHISVRNIFDDHKFFILWKVLLTLFGVAALQRLNRPLLIYLCMGILVASGCMNFFVLKNDVYARIPDYSLHPMFLAIKKPSVVITNAEIYDPANVAGVKTLTGRLQYSFVYGGNPDPAVALRSQILSGNQTVFDSRELSHIICYTDAMVPNLFPCSAEVLTQRYSLVYTDSLGSVWSTLK